MLQSNVAQHEKIVSFQGSAPLHYYRDGPIMSANFFTSGFKYECKLHIRSVQIWVQLLTQKGPNISANNLVWKVALIFGPTYDGVCTHIWTDLWSSLHSYLDPLVKKFALIIGPPRYLKNIVQAFGMVVLVWLLIPYQVVTLTTMAKFEILQKCLTIISILCGYQNGQEAQAQKSHSNTTYILSGLKLLKDVINIQQGKFPIEKNS